MSAQYVDWISGSDVKETAQLRTGEGGIISSGLKKLAVYRDTNNKLHTYSTVCPHLGGIFQWNAAEKSFDCPAHGSRFSTEGKVVNGPVISDLKNIIIKE